jgi:hypothetical protein
MEMVLLFVVLFTLQAATLILAIHNHIEVKVMKNSKQTLMIPNHTQVPVDNNEIPTSPIDTLYGDLLNQQYNKIINDQ